MKKASKSRPSLSRKPSRAVKKKVTTPPVSDTDRPGGKLGLILDRLGSKSGVTADELVKVTGWQRHSVLGALSKLKARGFEFHLDAYAERKAYRLAASKG